MLTPPSAAGREPPPLAGTTASSQDNRDSRLRQGQLGQPLAGTDASSQDRCLQLGQLGQPPLAGTASSGQASCLQELPGDKYPSCCTDGGFVKSTEPQVAPVTGSWHPINSHLRALSVPPSFTSHPPAQLDGSGSLRIAGSAAMQQRVKVRGTFRAAAEQS